MVKKITEQNRSKEKRGGTVEQGPEGTPAKAGKKSEERTPPGKNAETANREAHASIPRPVVAARSSDDIYLAVTAHETILDTGVSHRRPAARLLTSLPHPHNGRLHLQI